MLWPTKSNSLASDLYYQNGVIYWVPLDNLRAVDLQTGKLQWNLDHPESTEVKGRISKWHGFVTDVPGENGEKGRILLLPTTICTVLRQSDKVGIQTPGWQTNRVFVIKSYFLEHIPDKFLSELAGLNNYLHRSRHVQPISVQPEWLHRTFGYIMKY
jgi:hypothetical protein